MVGKFFLVPADADAKLQTTVAENIQSGGSLGKRQNVVFKRQGDSKSQEKFGGVFADLSEADERVHHRRVLPRHIAAGGIGRCSRDWDVAVLTNPDRVKPGVFKHRSKNARSDVCGSVHRCVADFHVAELSPQILNAMSETVLSICAFSLPIPRCHWARWRHDGSWSDHRGRQGG